MGAQTFVLEDGVPVRCTDLEEWRVWIERSFWDRVVASGTVGRYEVTTIFAGIDLLPQEGSAPALWDTQVSLDRQELPDYRRTYRSLDEALSGHAEIVARISKLGTVAGEIDCTAR